jgi:hypothetical protein
MFERIDRADACNRSAIFAELPVVTNASEEAPRNIVLMQGSVKYPGYTHVALEISNYESAIRQIEELDLPITGLVDFEGAKFFFIRGPDDNVIEFHQPASGSQGPSLYQCYAAAGRPTSWPFVLAALGCRK